MPLKRLIYISRVTMPATPHDLQRLHALSERSNRQLDITGALGFTGRYFIQCIEGREAAIDALMARIQSDPRHADVVELCTITTAQRRFGQWSMQYFDSHVLDDDVHQVHQAGRHDPERAQWLIDRMTQTLPPGQGLHQL